MNVELLSASNQGIVLSLTQSHDTFNRSKFMAKVHVCDYRLCKEEAVLVDAELSFTTNDSEQFSNFTAKRDLCEHHAKAILGDFYDTIVKGKGD